jgi:hypothetical protein
VEDAHADRPAAAFETERPTLGGRVEDRLVDGVRWGLTNAAYFSRAFRSAYGVSPLDYRRGYCRLARKK